MTPCPTDAPAAIATKPFALRAQAFATTAAVTSPRAIRQHQHQQQPTRSGATSSVRGGATANGRGDASGTRPARALRRPLRSRMRRSWRHRPALRRKPVVQHPRDVTQPTITVRKQFELRLLGRRPQPVMPNPSAQPPAILVLEAGSAHRAARPASGGGSGSGSPDKWLGPSRDPPVRRAPERPAGRPAALREDRARGAGWQTPIKTHMDLIVRSRETHRG